MPLLQGCDNNLLVLIQTKEPILEDWSFIYTIVDDVKINYSNTPSRHPIPFSTEITDNVKRNMDTITITGVIGCYSCGEILPDATNVVIPKLKELSNRSMYCPDEYVTLTSNDWMAKYMILTNVSINERQDRTHFKTITTTWVGANLTGSVRKSVFERGGIVASNYGNDIVGTEDSGIFV